MILLSCVNCCHNPLQSDAVGPQYGYCTQHRKLLLVPQHLTCGRLLRKDLPTASAAREREIHERLFTPAVIVNLQGTTHRPVNGSHTSASSADRSRLAADDKVADVVFSYGSLPTKMATIAPLRVLDGARPELAMLSLGRGYVRHCVANNGKWTSGLHLVWWTRKRLASEPEVKGTDLRTPSPLPILRQIELAQWALVMMRLMFISDVASYAKGTDRFGKLAGLAEHAAEKTGALSCSGLLRWVRREGVPAFDAVLPEERYDQLAADVRKEPLAED